MKLNDWLKPYEQYFTSYKDGDNGGKLTWNVNDDYITMLQVGMDLIHVTLDLHSKEINATNYEWKYNKLPYHNPEKGQQCTLKVWYPDQPKGNEFRRVPTYQELLFKLTPETIKGVFFIPKPKLVKGNYFEGIDHVKC